MKTLIETMQASRYSLLLWSVLTLLPAVGLSAESVDPLRPGLAYGSKVEYTVFRNDKRIGSHTVIFSREGDVLAVDVASKLVVRVLKIPVYRFNYRAREQWQNGQLLSIDATVKEKGDTSSVSLRRAGQNMRLTTPDGSTTLEQLEFASNHWHAGVLSADVLFNTLTGKSNKIDIENQGTEILMINGAETQATHYRYSGELQTEVWYDDRMRWVKLRFKGSDGSIIEYRCDGFFS